MLCSSVILSTALLALLEYVLADATLDQSRLGEYYTAIPIYRSGAGTNVVSLGIGSPAQDFNLTLTTNVEFIMVATTDCHDCVEDADEFIPAQSTSITPENQDIVYNLIQPFGSTETISLSSLVADDILTDPRQDTTSRSIALVTLVQENGDNTVLTSGTTGFFGLGINQETTKYSIIASVLETNIDGNHGDPPSLLVGFDLGEPTNQTAGSTGTMHWGGAPTSSYEGDFNWLNVNTTVAGSWGLPVDRMRAGGKVVDTSSLYGSLDPGYDGIYVPNTVAEALWSAVNGASRDLVDATRWNIPCNANISMSITISGYEYLVSSTALVQKRDIEGTACWGNLIAWKNGTLPDTLGEVRLGTAFMSGIYSVIYYDGGQQLIGIAGKPGSVNSLNVNGAGGHVNTKLAGILIGTLLFALILIFIMCYARNRSRFQSVWYRAVRRQHRFQTNALVRAATMPPIPPMMPMPLPMRAPIMAPMPGPMYQPLQMYQPPLSMAMPMQAPMSFQRPPQPWPQQIQPHPAGAQGDQRRFFAEASGGRPMTSPEYGPYDGEIQYENTVPRRRSGERNVRSLPRQQNGYGPPEQIRHEPPRSQEDRHKSLPALPRQNSHPAMRPSMTSHHRATEAAFITPHSKHSNSLPADNFTRHDPPGLRRAEGDVEPDTRTHASLPRQYSGPEAQEWVSRYQGPGEGEQRYPVMPALQTAHDMSGADSSPGNSRAQRFWGRKSRGRPAAQSTGHEAAGMTKSAFGGPTSETTANRGQEKRKSWLGFRGSPGASERRREAERTREREMLLTANRDGGHSNRLE